MWKWTRPDNIQLLILDGDTLEEEFLTYPYSKDDKVIKTVVVTKSDKLTGHKNSIKFFDFYDLIQEIIEKEKCESYSIISISKDILFLKSMMEYHIGTILVKKFLILIQKDMVQKSLQHIVHQERKCHYYIVMNLLC